MTRVKLSTLYERISEGYLDLRALNPRHELLNYFYSDERRIWLKLDTDFQERFGGEVEPRDFSSFDDFAKAKVRVGWRNYLNSLVKAKSDFIRGLDL